MKAFANWGRFFAKIPNDLAARALSADAGITRADYFDAALTQPVPEGTTALGRTRHLIFAGLSPSDSIRMPSRPTPMKRWPASNGKPGAASR